MKRLLPVLIVLITAITTFATDLNSGGLSGIHTIKSAKSLGLGGVNLGATFKYGTQWDFVSSTTANREDKLHLFSGNIFAGVGIAQNWDIAVMLPLYADITGWDSIKTADIGDVEIATRLTLPVMNKTPFMNAALLFTLTTPTGSTKRGAFTRHTYIGSENFYSADRLLYAPGAALTFNFDNLKKPAPMRIHLNGETILSKEKKYNSAFAGIGLEVFPLDWLNLFTEAYGTIRFDRVYLDKFYSHLNNGQIWISPGAKIKFENGLYMILSGDFGLSEKDISAHDTYSSNGETYTTKDNAAYNIKYTFGWRFGETPLDSDKDSISNKDDLCPDVAEDFDGYKDGDGCPEVDNDNDGIPDSLDKCPNDPEDKDGFEDIDGCPDLDNDNDGIADSLDKCPLIAEDKNGIADSDGCPELDGDSDGILDSLDKCPTRKEDIDNFEDTDGCPDIDNDKDGILDSLDKCPNNAEDMDNFDDKDGCPDEDNDLDGVVDSLDKCPLVKGTAHGKGCPEATEISRAGLVLEGVTFKSGSAIIMPSSFQTLDDVVKSLNDWPEVKLEVQGHTDISGSRATNVRISLKRAQAVLDYFARKGISTSRLKAKGYGPDRPIASNNTASGRAANRRVELKRTDIK